MGLLGGKLVRPIVMILPPLISRRLHIYINENVLCVVNVLLYEIL